MVEKISLGPGDKVIEFKLPSLNGGEFDLNSYIGAPFMISFFRFASCPFCNLRMRDLVRLNDELKDTFQHIAIFESPLKTMQKHAKRLSSPFPVLSDPQRVVYKKYGVQRSVLGMIKGMTVHSPTILKGMLKGFVPTEVSRRYLTMPANFLIDETGIIRAAYYGQHEGDHMPLDEVKTFFLKYR
jgi:peroxiredoxin